MLKRLWPVLATGAVVVVLLALTWLGSADSSEQIRQDKVMLTAVILVLASLVLLVWAAFFSRLPQRTQRWLVAGVLVLVAGFFVMFRYRGVSGDLVPQFELRFQTASMELADVNQTSLRGAADYPQFLGADRIAHVEGVRLARNWSVDPPKLLWRQPVGRGWSGFAVSGNAAVTHEQHSAEERVVRYELSTGRVEWASREVAHYVNALAGEGPRATPTIHDGRVYAMGGTGLLTVLDLESGELLWKRDVLADSGGKVPTWGKSDSPLLLEEDELVVVGAGSALAAYRAEDGELAWSVSGVTPAYGSPLLTTLAGVRQIVSFNAGSLTGHDPEEGTVLWKVDWPRQQPNVAQPLILDGDRVLASAGYGVGARLFHITDEGAELVWESLRLKSKFAHFIYYEGYVYGLDDGILVCLDPETGRRKWKRGRYGHGQLLLVEDLLLVQSEHGDIILIDPSPDELRELTRFTVMDGKIWNTPALAGRYLLVRNDAEAALFEMPVVASGS